MESKVIKIRVCISCVNFEEHAKVMGRTGGFRQIKTVVDYLRELWKDKTLLMDGGDTWQGSATLWTRGKDMVEAMNLLWC